MAALNNIPDQLQPNSSVTISPVHPPEGHLDLDKTPAEDGDVQVGLGAEAPCNRVKVRSINDLLRGHHEEEVGVRLRQADLIVVPEVLGDLFHQLHGQRMQVRHRAGDRGVVRVEEGGTTAEVPDEAGGNLGDGILNCAKIQHMRNSESSELVYI